MSSPTAKSPPASVEKASNKAEENVKKVEETANKGPPSAIEFEPPLACVRRILKNSLPSSTNVGKDASAAFARASGIFIIYVTACANDFARENRRQTITANDVLAAIKELEFDEFTPELNKFLERYRESEKSKKEAKAKAKASAEDVDDDEQKVATPQSVKSKDENADVDASMVDDGEQTEEEDREEDREGDMEGEDEDDLEDMEE